VLAVLLATAGAVMSIKYFDNSFSNDHQRIGLAFYIIMWLQALIGIFRPHRGSKGRSIWFVFHWLVGISVSLLGVINIYTGLQAYHDRTSKNVRVWTIIFTLQISLILFFYILQEKWNYIQKQGAVLGNKPVQPTDQEMSPSVVEATTTRLDLIGQGRAIPKSRQDVINLKKAEFLKTPAKMQNEEGQNMDLYIPRKCSATNRLITSKDNAPVQINIGHVDARGIYAGPFSTFALCGFIRAQGDG
ncbi:UNVERIFIED_CONTAM: Cytochrome domain-containing protein, partial [Sesamum indicum]